MLLNLRILSVFYLLNGLLMLAAPAFWYEITPGVEHSGALNVHFIRDIGLAFCAASVWALLPKVRYLTPLVFIGGHGGLHLVEIFGGHFSLGEILRDGVLIVLPAAVFSFLIFTQRNKNHA